MPYAQKDTNGNIIGLCANQQGAEVFLAGDDPAVAAFLNPPIMQARTQYGTAIAAGLSVTWQTSTTLNATYGLGNDPITGMSIISLIMSEMVSINTNGAFTNGQSTRNWPDATGTMRTLTVAQAKILFTAIALYVDQLATALAAAQQGETPTWPSSSVTLNA